MLQDFSAHLQMLEIRSGEVQCPLVDSLGFQQHQKTQYSHSNFSPPNSLPMVITSVFQVSLP
jgi:hypothetical protein